MEIGFGFAPIENKINNIGLKKKVIKHKNTTVV